MLVAQRWLFLAAALTLPLACRSGECDGDGDCEKAKVCDKEQHRCVFPSFGWREGDARVSVKEELATKRDDLPAAKAPLPPVGMRPKAVDEKLTDPELRRMADLLDSYANSDRAACAMLPEIAARPEGERTTPSRADWVAYCNAIVDRAPAACAALHADTAPDLQASCTRFFAAVDVDKPAP